MINCFDVPVDVVGKYDDAITAAQGRLNSKYHQRLKELENGLTHLVSAIPLSLLTTSRTNCIGIARPEIYKGYAYKGYSMLCKGFHLQRFFCFLFFASQPHVTEREKVAESPSSPVISVGNRCVGSTRSGTRLLRVLSRNFARRIFCH